MIFFRAQFQKAARGVRPDVIATRTGFRRIKRFRVRGRRIIERTRRLQLPPVIRAVDELASIPRQRMNRPGQPRRCGDDDFRFASRIADDGVAAGLCGGVEAPNSKHQAPETLQAPKKRSTRRVGLKLGVWMFSGSWRLVLGAFHHLSSCKRRATSSALARLLKALMRKKPSPFEPKPDPGVMTTFASARILSNACQLVTSFGVRTQM